MRYYSIIIPVYNRPDEVDDLLHSLSRQIYRRKTVRPCLAAMWRNGMPTKCWSVIS